MRNTLLVLIFCCYSFGAYTQIDISPSAWQEDLIFLQKTVHDDYPFLFKKVSRIDFDREVGKLHTSIPSLEEHQIIVGYAKIVSLFGYGHTSISLSAWWDREPIQFHQMPYNLVQFSDGVFVQGVHKLHEVALGARVLEIEGVPISQSLAAVKPVFPAENDQFFKAYGLTYLGIPEILHAQGVLSSMKSTIELTLQKDEEVFKEIFSAIETERFPGRYSYIQENEEWLDARDNSSDPFYLKNLDRIYYFEYLPENKTVYVRHSQIQDDEKESIPAFYERLFSFINEHEVDKLILDVRLNGGGNNYKNKAIVTGVIACKKINKAGKFFVIISGKTYSACQNLVNELDTYTEAIFVGEPTGENINFYGDNRQVILPNSKIPVRLSYAWWQDKPQWENGDWTKPHIAIDMSFEDYRTNKDPVLEAVLKFTDDQFILDPMAYLTDLYLSGKGETLKTEAERMVKDPNYKFFDFEGEFNGLGYKLLGQGQLETAISVFQMVADLFPESANAWDSLAEGHWKAGRTDTAINFYKKAIELDPSGAVGDNARKMLMTIKENK